MAVDPVVRVGWMRVWEEGPQEVARSSGASRLVAFCPLPDEFHPYQEAAISRGLTLETSLEHHSNKTRIGSATIYLFGLMLHTILLR